MTGGRTFFAGAAAAAAVLVLAGTLAGPAAAQSGPPNALQGFSQNRNQPIRIEAGTLEVRDKDKTATFSDNVKVTQGDTTLESRRLIVFYDGSAATASRRPAADTTVAQNQQIRRLEAKGGVVVTQRGQTAVGEEGIYDVTSNSVVLVGNVVVTHGKNVIRGHRLWVDLATGTSRVESQSGGGRVQGVFMPQGGGGEEPFRPTGQPAPISPVVPQPQVERAAPPLATSRAPERLPGSPAPAQPPRRMY